MVDLSISFKGLVLVKSIIHVMFSDMGEFIHFVLMK